ncbi:MAG: flagellar basal body rod protein FlgB [Gemmataceae bacterium]|jgi:flagellar basal-body rod protein FlgB|nr:flagellar basal body rod protein FlgB [Gemmataceae bacterium]
MELSIANLALYQRVLDTAALRHKVIANNIANVNTPGFKRLDVSFEQLVARNLQRGESLTELVPQVVEDEEAVERVDGNTVQIDLESNLLTQNALIYTAMNQLVAFRLGQIRSAITGR